MFPKYSFFFVLSSYESRAVFPEDLLQHLYWQLSPLCWSIITTPLPTHLLEQSYLQSGKHHQRWHPIYKGWQGDREWIKQMFPMCLLSPLSLSLFKFPLSAKPLLYANMHLQSVRIYFYFKSRKLLYHLLWTNCSRGVVSLSLNVSLFIIYVFIFDSLLCFTDCA